jgi:hypothetical protein
LTFPVVRETIAAMGGMASTAPDPSVVRRPHRRPPRRVRWPRRIAGVLATLGLLGIAALMASMVLPADNGVPAAAQPAPAPTPPAKAAAAGKRTPAKAPAPLSAKQRKVRGEAVTLLRAQGYLPTRAKDYDPRREVRVLIGYRNGDPLGPRRAFFFVGNRSVGYDSTVGSSRLKLVTSGKHSVTLAYGVFAPGDKLCCPSSTTKVKFKWNGSALLPQGAIPSGRLATG